MNILTLIMSVIALFISIIQIIRPIRYFGLDRRWHAIFLFIISIAFFMSIKAENTENDPQPDKNSGYTQQNDDSPEDLRKKELEYLKEKIPFSDEMSIEDKNILFYRLTKLDPGNAEFKKQYDITENKIKGEAKTVKRRGEELSRNMKESTKEIRKEVEKIDGEKRPEKYVDLKKMDWWTDGFGSIMMANITLHNRSPISIKDIHIRCDLTASSGTLVGIAEKTIYDVIQAGKTKTFRELNFGFIHDQAKRSQCFVVAVKPY